MGNFIDALVAVTGDISDWLYSNLLFWVLIVVGIFFTLRTGFVQIRLFPEGIRVLTEKSHDGGISSFQALMIATASRVGTGNIARNCHSHCFRRTGRGILDVDYGYYRRCVRLCRVYSGADL